jgi:protein-disulfide isomerase
VRRRRVNNVSRRAAAVTASDHLDTREAVSFNVSPPKGEVQMLSKRARSLLLGFATLAACGGSASDIEDLKKGQKDILAKLDGLEKNIQQIRAQPAAQPPRPQLDPNKVYSIPIADSPVRGPRTAKVSIVEFSDFQ